MRHTFTPRSSDSLGTRGFRLYFGVTPFGRPCRVEKNKHRETNVIQQCEKQYKQDHILEQKRALKEAVLY